MVITVTFCILELVEVVFGDWPNKDDGKVCSVVSTAMLDEVDSIEFVLDEIAVDVADVESGLDDAKSVGG